MSRDGPPSVVNWGLPSSAEIGGREYTINTDFRDVLEIIEVMQDPEKHERIRTLVALSLFYDGFEDMPPDDYHDALQWMVEFINCGEPDDGTPHPKTIDWEQDRLVIAAEVNKVAGTEIRALPHLHWWTFIAYFNSIGEGQLSYIVSIREKLRKGKPLEKHEREFYRQNRTRVDFKQKFTQADEDLLSKWMI